jgi:hypothetical protein
MKTPPALVLKPLAPMLFKKLMIKQNKLLVEKGLARTNQGILKGEVSLYHRPPV